MFDPGQTAAGRRVWFTRLGTLLKPNDPLLLVFDAARGEPFRVKSVTPENPARRTRVVLQEFRTVAVFGDGRAAAREAGRRFQRAVTGFEEAVSDLPPDPVGTTRALTTPDWIASIRTNAIEPIRAAFLVLPETVTPDQIVALNATIQATLQGGDGPNPAWWGCGRWRRTRTRCAPGSRTTWPSGTRASRTT